MKLSNTLLVVSLIIVWCSVFIKYETFARRGGSSSRSRSSSRSSGSTFRFRSSFGGGSRSGSSSSNSEGFRFRSTFGGGSRSGSSSSDSEKSSFGGKSVESSPSDSSKQSNRFGSLFKRSSASNNPSYPGASASSGKSTAKIIFDKLASKISMAKTSYLPSSSINKGMNQPGYSVRAPYNHYSAGSYYGYNYRPTQYKKIKGSLCTNYNDYGGIVLDQFYCPIEGFSSFETACCGTPGDQYCCSPVSQHRHTMSAGFGYIAFIIISIIIIVVIVLVFINFRSKKKYSELSNSN